MGTGIDIEIASAFAERRAYPFLIDRGLVAELRQGTSPEALAPAFGSIRDAVFDEVAGGDRTVRAAMGHDARLSDRVAAGIALVHGAIAEGGYTTLPGRRFVLVRERPETGCLYRGEEGDFISDVGDGPSWMELPSVYVGLGVFDVIDSERRRGGRTLFEAFRGLLLVEERAIETGYSRTERFPEDVERGIARLVEEVLRAGTRVEVEYEKVPARRKLPPFTADKRRAVARMLDARAGWGFDVSTNLKALDTLERRARQYKRSGDEASLREVLRLLVAASGHDVHEVRDRSNVLIERVLAPKEFDAPLASSFCTVRMGAVHTFRFTLPRRRSSYFVRIYGSRPRGRLFVEGDIGFEDVPLRHDEERDEFVGEHRFDLWGQRDFVVFERRRRRIEWLALPGTSGRINVIGDLRGEIILEIFTDIHGHTRMYWDDGSGHPGLVYNEHGEVIRLGRFPDVAAHLEDLKARYGITAVYLLGVQKRGRNRSDWAPGATSPSPFSPMSLVEIEDSLGGGEELGRLVSRAHGLGIKVVVDVVPHLNRASGELPDEDIVMCIDASGGLTPRASTDGRYGSWNDGKLLNWRRLEVWEWLRDSILTLIERYDIDGIRFDSAHALPIMMKRDVRSETGGRTRSHEQILEGTVVTNEKEGDRFITTGYYDSACRGRIAVPLHFFLMLAVERKLSETGKASFMNIAECFWGHERYLSRTGVVVYNSALFKICESIIHGGTDVRAVYNLYENHYARALPPGTEMLGILGNHDERRALNTFGPRGLRPAVALTVFMSNALMDYEGSAEGEGWKVYLDNVFVNWNQFESAADRSLGGFYREWYSFHVRNAGESHLVRTDNPMVAAAVRFVEDGAWIGVFNFSDSNQSLTLDLENPALPVDDDGWYRLSDPVYSPITGRYGYYTGRELRVSRLHTTVSYTDRVKLLRLERIEAERDRYGDMLRDSLYRLCEISEPSHFDLNFCFREMFPAVTGYEKLRSFLSDRLVPAFGSGDRRVLALGIKRALFHMWRKGIANSDDLLGFIEWLSGSDDPVISSIGGQLRWHNSRGPIVFLSAEAEPFSKSGGLANVVYELPRELALMGEDVYLITPLYQRGDEKSMDMMRGAVERHSIRYTGRNVRFKILDDEYEVGVHHGLVDGIKCYLLHHDEFFDGLYWGYTAEEKLRRRIAFSRACAEVLVGFGIHPHFTFTNDAFAGIFNGIVRADPIYGRHPTFQRTTFVHVIHNGGWQYFDNYYRYERGWDHFRLFNMPAWKASDFGDPDRPDHLNCMATSVRFADQVVTVSPSYARQIRRACDGLEKVLHDVVGVSNAIGPGFEERMLERFEASGILDRGYGLLLERIGGDPDLRRKIGARFPEILEGSLACGRIEDPDRREIVTRMRNKLLLQADRGLAVDPDRILFAMIHRITEQKGYQLLLEASEGVFKTLGFQGVIGGAVAPGDSRGEQLSAGVESLARYYPGSVSFRRGFQDVSAPLLAADVFLMPSLSEPGGISQLEAFACGCPVVARATGGLRDTVFALRSESGRIEGNGFLFTDATAWSFYDAMVRCASFFRSASEETILAARRNARRSVYTWDTPARKYLDNMYDFKEVLLPSQGIARGSGPA